MEFTFPIIMIVIDSVYLGLFSSSFVRMVENIQNADFSINAAGAFLTYIIMSFALYYFIIRERKPVMDAFLLGLVIYGVFDFTNLAIFKKYEWTNSIIDTLWGGVLFALTTYITYKLYKVI